jgi:hypothetical protein
MKKLINRDLLNMLLVIVMGLMLTVLACGQTPLVAKVAAPTPPIAKIDYSGYSRGHVVPPVAKISPEPVKPPKLLLQAPTNTFGHDCGCPSWSCNCGAGGCHCTENRPNNRAQMRWVYENEMWCLKRGTQLLGALNSKGSYYLWLGSDYATEPCKPPLPLPQSSSAASGLDTRPQGVEILTARTIPVCRS